MHKRSSIESNGTKTGLSRDVISSKESMKEELKSQMKDIEENYGNRLKNILVLVKMHC